MDLISRQAAIEALEEPRKVPDTWTDEYAVGERTQWEKDVKALNSLPSAERRGRWENIIRNKYDDDEATCSLCGRTFMSGYSDPSQWDYCQNCGAQMEES